jgi:hypothetical protein
VTRLIIALFTSVLLAAGGALLMAHGAVWSIGAAFGMWLLSFCASPMLIDNDDWPSFGIFISAMLMISGGIFSGSLAYHGIAGERVDAVVTAVECVPGSEPCDERYRVSEWSTERDLGRLLEETDREYEPGDRLKVSMDPVGWAAPLVRDDVAWWSWIGLVAVLIGLAGGVGTTLVATVLNWRSK